MISTSRLFSVFSCSCLAFIAATAWADQQPAKSDAARNGHFEFQIGGFDAYQGKAQHVDIAGLIGDNFSVTHHHDQSVLFGAGYLFNGYCSPKYNLYYGINAFYLTPTRVKGNVTQENLFTNLSYQYSVTNIPIYLAGKAVFNVPSPNFSLTLDGGLGVNILQTCDFSEKSLDGGITLPDRAFSGKTVEQFSAMVGFGLQVNHAIASMPVEIDYRFFYLGNGSLNKISPVLDNLKTRNAYANALVFNLSV